MVIEYSLPRISAISSYIIANKKVTLSILFPKKTHAVGTKSD